MSVIKDPYAKSRTFLGAALLILGAALLLAGLAPLALQFHQFLDSSGASLFGFLPALGLSLLRTVQAVAFHQVHFFSLFLRILLSFSAILVMAAALRIFVSNPAGVSAKDRLASSPSVRRDLR